MVTLDSENIYNYSVKIKYPGLPAYLDKYFSFYTNSYPVIVNYFSGVSSSIDPKHFKTLFELIKESIDISNNTILNKAKLTVYYDWEFVEYFDELKDNLYAITKTSKFLRSSRTNSSYSDKVDFNYVLMQNQTLENVSKKVLGSDNFDNDWVDIAMRNDLSEVEYSKNSHNNLVLSLNRRSTNMDVRSVVDNISGEKIYGKDIDRILTFENDDLRVLGYKDTVNQSVSILCTMKKGDHPEFFELGVSDFVGDNLNAFAYGTMVRQLGETFSSDDTLVDLIVKVIKPTGTDIYVEFSVSTRLDYVVENTTNI